MKILMVNKFFYIKGGSETYYFALKRELESEGHEVIDFSMQDPKNFESPYSDYFVKAIDYNGPNGIKDKIRAAANIIYSREAKKKFEKLVKDTKPDIVHLHIFQHQLSPSILDVCKKYNLPVVYTAHDLKMLCLNYVMMTHGEVCEKCKGGHYINCAKNKCVKDSFAKSMINVCEGYLHKWRKSYDVIDRIITPSNFYRKKFIEFGVSEDRVIHLANFLDRECPHVNKTEDKYFLYFGRLSREKGIMTLIKAFEKYVAQGGEYDLKIVGSGPCKDEIADYIFGRGLTKVHLLGYKSGQELIDIVGNAEAVVLPSEWYENGPYSAIEALQLGRPIIGSELGGIPELIDGNGYIFNHGNVDELAGVLSSFPADDAEAYKELSANSLKIFERNYTAPTHYAVLKDIYKDAIEAKKG